MKNLDCLSAENYSQHSKKLQLQIEYKEFDLYRFLDAPTPQYISCFGNVF